MINSDLVINIIVSALFAGLAIGVSITTALSINADNKRRSLIIKIKQDLKQIKDDMLAIGSKTSDKEIIGEMMFNHSIKVRKLEDFLSSNKPNFIKGIVIRSVAAAIFTIYACLIVSYSRSSPDITDYIIPPGAALLLMTLLFHEVYKNVTSYIEKIENLEDIYLSVKYAVKETLLKLRENSTP